MMSNEEILSPAEILHIPPNTTQSTPRVELPTHVAAVSIKNKLEPDSYFLINIAEILAGIQGP